MREIASKMSVEPQQACLRKTNKRSAPLLLGCLILLLQGCATTPPAPNPSEAARAQAKAAYLANDYKRTLTIVEPLAIAGEGWAQYTLGYMYHYGRGVAMDRQMSKQWIERAAQQGYAPAQEALQRISLPQSKQKEEMGSAAKPPLTDVKDGAAPAATITEQKQESVRPTSQTATDIAAAAPTDAVPVTTGAPTNPAEQSEPVVQPPAPPSQQTAQNGSTPPAPTLSTPPRPTVPAATTESPASPPPSAMPSTPPQALVTNPAENGVNGRNWIMAQDPQQYTVQLIGSSSEAAVIRFIRKHGIEQEAAYYSTTRNGQPWFTVVYGSFPSREAAHQAAQRLPPSLRNASPWLRSFRDIQALFGQTP